MARLPLALVLAALLLPAAADGRARHCGPMSAHTDAGSRLVRVYSVEDKRGLVLHYFACYRTGGRPLLLGSVDENDSSSGTETGLAAASGHYAAFVNTRCAAETCGFRVRIVDVSRRAVVQYASRRGSATEVVLSREGLAGLRAFEDTEPVGRAPDRYVLKLDAAGATKLDSGPGITKLSLRAERLFWMSGSARRYAALIRRRTCGPRGADFPTVAGSASMRVYTQDNIPYTDYFACLFRGGKPVMLGESFDGEGSDPGNYLVDFRFAGRYVAFVDDGTGGPVVDPSFAFSVLDVRRRRVVHSFERSGFHGNTVVTAAGQAGILVTSPEPYVEALDARGETECDRGSGVRRLRLRGGTLHWLHGDTPMSYRLR